MQQQAERVVIGVVPNNWSVTIEVRGARNTNENTTLYRLKLDEMLKSRSAQLPEAARQKWTGWIASSFETSKTRADARGARTRVTATATPASTPLVHPESFDNSLHRARPAGRGSHPFKLGRDVIRLRNVVEFRFNV